jgi:hypothetical protein
MVMSARPAAGVAMLVVMLAASPARTLAQTFERPPTFDVAKIKGLQPSGDNYTINNPVRSDGLLRLYTLTTPYGDFMPQGDQMLRMRVNELLALHELEKISSSESYGKALVDAGLSPFKYTGKLIINPAKTVGDTFSGIGTMFGRITSDVANAGKTPGDPLAGLLGVSDQRRKIATKVGVDPYTDFPPLDAKLSSLSQAAAAGGLTVSAAMLAVPVGFAGIVFSNLSTASTLEGVRIDELARDQTAAQIFDINREKLRAMGADIDLTEALLVNRSYTPIDMAVIVAALDSLVGVEDREVFLRRVVQVKQRPIAFFMRRHAEMLAVFQKRGAGFARFVSLGGYPFNVTRDGRIVGAMPIDALAWTQTTASVLRDSASDARRIRQPGRVELHISGTATALAKKELQAMGWKVVENAKF